MPISFFSDCPIVKSYTKDVVYDLTREVYYFLPKNYNLINATKEELNFLKNEELIFEPSDYEINCFPPLDLRFKYPFHISNTIVRVNDIKSIIKKLKLIDELSEVLVVKINKNVFNSFQFLIDFLITSSFNQVIFEIQIESFKLDQIMKIIEKIAPLGFIGLHFFGTNKYIEEVLIKTSKYQVFTRFIESMSYQEKLYVNTQIFTESHHHNPYFNRKLYIGSNGEIKNAPECKEIQGNINDINTTEELKKIISSKKFQKYWHVKPDMIDVSKECEFRYMSIDNRIPHQRKDGSWYYKEEPNYNPYIAKWKEEEGYRTLAECGVICNEEEFSIDHDKIAEINKELWSE